MEDNIMANIRKPRVSKEEQLKLINECRSSGMTDSDWCREHGIAVSTFYYWVKQLRRESAQIPEPAYGLRSIPVPDKMWFPLISYRNTFHCNTTIHPLTLTIL